MQVVSHTSSYTSLSHQHNKYFKFMHPTRKSS
jgi:hypothetical protein